MPSLINPEQNNGKKEHIIWVDELCASCKGVENCPLIQALHRHTIMTYSGIHVSNCDLYDPDVTSEYYLESEDLERATAINLATMEQQMRELTALLERINGPYAS